MEKISNRDVLEEQFFSVLTNRHITTVFQPIVSLYDGSVFGYEALSRGPQGTELEDPGALFECAEMYGKLWELEFLCRAKAIEAASGFHGSFRLFLNVHPQIIHDDKFRDGFTREYLSQYAIDPENIIFEITERGAVGNISDFIRTINHYKDQNYKIAIDDAGAGYSGLNLITDIQPHFIKLDMNLIRNIDKDMFKQSLIKSFHQFATLTNTRLIAEGIETKRELLELIEIGVCMGQGFYLQKPAPSAIPVHGNIVQSIVDANRKKNQLCEKKTYDLSVSDITADQAGIDTRTSVSEAFEIMEKDRSVPGICVTADGIVRGIVTRNNLYRHLSRQYGYNLYYNKPIDHIMDTEFLQVDYQEDIEAVSQKAMGRGYENLYDFIAVTKEGRYYGIVTVKDLLEKAFQAEVNNAKHLNPLSELPGNVLIEKKLEECLNASSESTVLYVDINDFKAYNDVYGFENGDRLLKNLTQILKKNISRKRNFIGHIGGDDFLVILHDDNAETLCQTIIREFDESVLQYYNRNDLDRGYITTKNRHGREENFPILSISIVAASLRDYSSIYDLSEDVARLKRLCKQKPGSNYLMFGGVS